MPAGKTNQPPMAVRGTGRSRQVRLAGQEPQHSSGADVIGQVHQAGATP
jgi:hypothetical protein